MHDVQSFMQPLAPLQIRTTYERSAAAIEAYWRDRKSNQEAQEAAKPKWVKVGAQQSTLSSNVDWAVE